MTNEHKTIGIFLFAALMGGLAEATTSPKDGLMVAAVLVGCVLMIWGFVRCLCNVNVE